MELEKIVLLKLNGGKTVPTIPKDMQGDKNIPLQSEFKTGTRDLIRGFRPDIERIVLPPLIGVQANDAAYASKARDFWADFSVSPSEEGLRLNIATEKKSIGKREIAGKLEDILEDFPVNPEDYMTWQIALQSSRVAKDPLDIESGAFDFSLIDLEEQNKQEVEVFENIEKAEEAYNKLIANLDVESNMEKLDMVLELMRDKSEAIEVTDLALIDKKMRLRDIRNSQPIKFVSTVSDPSIATKAKIVRMYNNGVITKEGDEYFDGAINIGKGKVAVAWFEKPENSGKVLALDARLRSVLENRKK